MTKENKNEELKMTLTMNNYDKQIFPVQQVAVFPFEINGKQLQMALLNLPRPLLPPP